MPSNTCRLQCQIFAWVLICYPQELRERFGEEMVAVFEDLLRDAVSRGDAAAVASLWARTLGELLSVALPSRFQINIVVAGVLSFAFSSGLFLVFFRALS